MSSVDYEFDYAILTPDSSPELIANFFSSTDQLSGIAFRRTVPDLSFGEEIFTAHVVPIGKIWVSSSAALVNFHTIAVRITSSQARNVSSIYRQSPMRSWINFFDSTLSATIHDSLKKYLLKNFVFKNFVGLLQIRCYSERPYFYVLRESLEIIKNRPFVLIAPNFLLILSLCLATPPSVLSKLVDFYKSKLHSMFIDRKLKRYKNIRQWRDGEINLGHVNELLRFIN